MPAKTHPTTHTAIKLRKNSSFRQGMPEPRGHGGRARFTSLCSGYRESMP